MAFSQLALFAGFALYLPELFPTSLRRSGTSSCCNVGRFLETSRPITMGVLQQSLPKGVTLPEEKLTAFRETRQWMRLIFLLALIARFLLKETKGQPLRRN